MFLILEKDIITQFSMQVYRTRVYDDGFKKNGLFLNGGHKPTFYRILLKFSKTIPIWLYFFMS